MRFRNDGFKNVVETVDTVHCRKSEQTEESAMKSLFEELGGTYHQEGDYFLPDLSLPKTAPVGIWGQRRRHYLKTQREPLYNVLLLNGKLDDHLAEIDTKAIYFTPHYMNNISIKLALNQCNNRNSSCIFIVSASNPTTFSICVKLSIVKASPRCSLNHLSNT